ncbi:MAG: type IX secretion system membrane protein PorP/SprF [candidate division KSB1 bacterium]|nr:type IX secretion system membrane protein PorP/SprF [candidate division KSB1 bacterium]MDZ7274644.1 type IX secretion system membrane protein PorP/SprF [candidate division KSB1 bacterium]MDZ7285469.1 type IX secretion system membrane protein PorP/SprF [candidate division KSB1 bacterium]MDZ7298501.1 type IX secretion system membrane protein PorP/SprF [candidate division KSB1 bacterium]MDZ7306275.1 type IX secretion system membrane protein PorP/SprF [candidate division KSB1 bacterium]
MKGHIGLNRLLAGLSVLLCAGGSAVFAQQRVTTPNPADLGDARVNLMNPAVLPWQDPMFFVGTSFLHAGVVDNLFAARNNMFSLTTTDRRLGVMGDLAFGVTGEYLNIRSLQNNLTLNGVVSRKFSDWLSLGFSLGVLNQALDVSGVEGLTPGDPALQHSSNWTFFNLGAGALVMPGRHLTLAFAVNNLNRPDISFFRNGNERLKRFYSAGATVGMSTFRGGLAMAQEGDDFISQLFLEAFLEERGFVKLAYGTEAITFEGQWHVGGGVSLNARYAYPVTQLSQASSGTPEISLLFNFRRHGSLYAARWLETDMPMAPAFSLSNAFQVQSRLDTLFILDKHIHRKVEANVSPKELAELPKELFFSADSLEPELPERIFSAHQNGAPPAGPHMGAARLLERLRSENTSSGRFRIPEDSTGIVKEMEKNHTKAYLASFRQLARRMQEPNFRSSIVIPADGQRAYLVLRYLELHGAVNDRLQVIVDSTRSQEHQNLLGAARIPEKVFHRTLSAAADTFFFSLNMEETRRWGPVSGSFVIEDAQGNIVFADSNIVGRSPTNNQILRKLAWNWKVQRGEHAGRLAPHGNYYYYLVWKSADNNVYHSPKKRLTIDHKTMPIVIRVSRDGHEAASDARYRATILVH